eukprot:Opistho-2@4570
MSNLRPLKHLWWREDFYARYMLLVKNGTGVSSASSAGQQRPSSPPMTLKSSTHTGGADTANSMVGYVATANLVSGSLAAKKYSKTLSASWGDIQSASVLGSYVVNADPPFAVYEIEVVRGEEKWIITRRYSDFDELHEQLLRNFSSRIIDSLRLPSKRWYKLNKFDPDFLLERQTALDEYLKAVLSHPVMRKCHYLRLFLSDEWRDVLSGTPENLRIDEYMKINPHVPAYGCKKGRKCKTCRGAYAPRNTLDAPLPSPTSASPHRNSGGWAAPAPKKLPPLLNKRVVALREEYDYERKWEPMGTPTSSTDNWFKKSTWKAGRPSFYDDVYPSRTQMAQKRLFLQDYHRQRFGPMWRPTNVVVNPN